MTAHSLATALIPFAATWISAVDRAIAAWNDAPPPAASATARLNATGVFHFASVTTAEISGDEAVIVIELSADVPEPAALRLFAGLFEAEIIGLLTQARILPPDRLDEWLLARRVRIGQSPFVACGLLFDGSPAMSVRRILDEAKLAAHIEDHAAWLKFAGAPAEKLAAIRRALWRDGGFKPFFVPLPAPFLDPAPASNTGLQGLRNKALIAYRFLIWPLPSLPLLVLAFALLPYHGLWFAHLARALLASVIVLLAAAGGLAWAIRWREVHESITVSMQTRQAAEQILRLENVNSQNILSTSSVLKPGLARRVTLQLVFYFIRTVLPLYWAPGRLGDLNDIHFMRWLLVPGSNILIFRSHYDGSWVNYIEDFALRAPQGVSAIWSNTLGFPRTRWLTRGGAADGPRFRQWVHTQTRPVCFNYSAYPGLSMERIRLHARIARAVATGVADEGVTGWLTSFGDADGGDF